MVRDEQTDQPRKIKYSPPQLLKLDVQEGKGLCSTGSGNVACDIGNSASNCSTGSVASLCVSGSGDNT